jgi:hypothetical protein
MEESRVWRKEHVSRRSWKRQATYVTPRSVPWFAGELARRFTPVTHAILVVDDLIFDVQDRLCAARRAAGETRTVREAPGHVIGGDPAELARMLELMLTCSVDFRVLFQPSAHALRADHDGFTTVFSTSAGWMAEVRKTMREAGVEMISADRWTADPP